MRAPACLHSQRIDLPPARDPVSLRPFAPVTGPSTGLRALGLSALEERAYRTLLRAPSLTTTQLGEQLDVPLLALEDAIACLAQKGLLSVTPERVARLVPSPPDIAIEALCLMRERELQLARLEIESLEREQF